jgi:hypothetical protein
MRGGCCEWLPAILKLTDLILEILGKLKHMTEEILMHCLGSDLSLYTLTGSSYIQREISEIHQPVQKVIY